ncbi:MULTISPECIES: phosphonatase-like hydrolase [Cryobacterium]|uniref:Phosphonatase-like hydrolase n=2 Tax=Cryobacterium TaxID=69578 RepID=A0A4R9AWK8_9MICO|nr:MULTISPECIES: phosphonatase-like hydrolase [Cryobacterium]TFD66298.1 phosphonatase-like hydrolase [Cryobacterium ruanii]TFD70635.1 phosphonatase-like hydrolase [Cryobacterium gelidum]
MTFQLASLDMAGTTINEGGIVYRVMREQLESAIGRAIDDSVISRWNGTSKRTAIVGVLDELGIDGVDADALYAHFLVALAARYESEPPTLFPGVRESVAELRSRGVKVALQTGYTRDIAESLMRSARWELDAVDALVTADDVAESRPAPYMIFRTMEATGVTDVRRVLVAGDTVNDLRAGTNAGAGYVVGVLTGAHDVTRLGEEEHTHLLPSLATMAELR